jgi:parallel beta-helix repeat protein
MLSLKNISVWLLTIFLAGCQAVSQEKDSENLISGLEIQNRIDQLPASGGKVKLPEGEIVIQKPIILKNNVWLQGEGRSTVLLVEDSAGIILQGLKGARVSDLVVKSTERHSAKTGILLENSGDCQVDNVLTQGFARFGIALTDDSFLCEISSSKSADNGQANFYFGNLNAGGRGGDFVPNLVNNCISYGGKYGFECDKAIVLNLTGCVVFQSIDYGYYLHSTSNSVNISGSRSFQVETDAVYVDNSHEVNISSNIFCWQRGNGIVLNKANWGTVSANNFIDNGVLTRDGSYKNGVVLENQTKGIQVTSNAIFNWGDQAPMEYGIIEDKTCAFNLIANNNINYYTREGISSMGNNTLVSNNVMKGDSAFIGMNRPNQYPDFDTLKIHEFIFSKL